MAVEPATPPMNESTLLRVEVVAAGPGFVCHCYWNEQAVERLREDLGDEVATKALRGFGADLVQSIEDILAGRSHPAGPCLPGCPYHGNFPHHGIPV